MGFSLGSLLDPGAMAHQVVDSVLPKDMQWVGGVVGAIVDYECGNAAGAVKQGMSALSDLKDVPQSSPADKPGADASTDAAKKTALSSTQSAPNQQWAYEPSPPQPRVTTPATTTVTSGPGTAPASPAKPSRTPATSGGWRASVQPFVRPESPNLGLVGHPPAQTATAASATGPASQTVTTTTTTSGRSSTPESAPSAKASAGASSTAAAKPSSGDPSTLSKDKFMNLSDDDLMKALRDGKVPPDVTDSQAGMMTLQARMDHISEMNKMMTSMMEAMHQMKMGVIENLRA